MSATAAGPGVIGHGAAVSPAELTKPPVDGTRPTGEYHSPCMRSPTLVTNTDYRDTEVRGRRRRCMLKVVSLWVSCIERPLQTLYQPGRYKSMVEH